MQSVTWSFSEEFRLHPAYEVGIDKCLRIVSAYSMASLTLDNAGQPEHFAAAIERELRGLLKAYDRRTGRTLR